MKLALLAVLGLMVVAGCGGGGGSATRPSPTITPSSAPAQSKNADPPAFQGEPDYRKAPITGAKDVALSDQDARELLGWTVRFANYLWTFNEGLTGGEERQKVWLFYTPRQQTRLPRPTDAEARSVGNAWGWQPGRQRLLWTSHSLAATLETSKDYPGDVKILVDHAQTVAEIHGPQPDDTSVALEVQKISGHWRMDTYNAYRVGGSFRLDGMA